MDQVLEIVEEVVEETAIVELSPEDLQLVGGGTLAGSLF
jgi:hypothetical protein